jgi:hypothetical protein
MRSPSELREQATRYYAMALMAHERGDSELAEDFVETATRVMEQADAAEAGQIIPPALREAAEPNVQQQQIQPKMDGDDGPSS